jgi:glutamate racemase
MPSPAIAPAPEDLRRRPVGVFDSGVGGLTVLHELLVQLPAEDFVYLADSARMPYGERSAAELEAFALEVAEELLARRIKLLVVACNSATSAALPALRERLLQTTLGVDVLGVVQPGAVQAVAATRNGRVGVLATRATVASNAYAAAIAAADPFVEVTQVATPELAPMIESGFPHDQRVVDAVRRACAPLRAAGVDTVVLGCTHYPLVRPILQRMLGRGVELISSGAPLARQVEHVLGARGLAHPRGDAPAATAGSSPAHTSPAGPSPASSSAAGLSPASSSAASSSAAGPSPASSSPAHSSPADVIVEGDYRFLCTGDAGAFRALGSRFLQLPLGPVETVTLGEPATALTGAGA